MFGIAPSRDGFLLKIKPIGGTFEVAGPGCGWAGAALPRGKTTRQRPGKIIEKMHAAVPRGLTSGHFLWKEFFIEPVAGSILSSFQKC